MQRWTSFVMVALVGACDGPTTADAPPTETGGGDVAADVAADVAPDVTPSDTTPSDAPAGEGIAARYPGDLGISKDPSVIFADDFESYKDATGLAANWNDGVYHEPKITTDPSNVHAGKQALEFVNPVKTTEWSNSVARHLTTELDVLYLRFYTKYDPRFDVVGSSHNGGGISAHYYLKGTATPGVPADGKNKFLVEYEAWRGEAKDPNPGTLNAYVYHPLQRSVWGDHFYPDGSVTPYSPTAFDFGPSFVPRPKVVPALGVWYCFEIMLKANKPGVKDGRITLWLDGKILADFPNLRLRDVDSLKIDRFNLSQHIGSNPKGEVKKWYDDVVAATEYIGPRR